MECRWSRNVGERQRAPERLPLPGVRAQRRRLPEGEPPAAADGGLRRQPRRQRGDPLPELRRQAEHQPGHGPSRRREPARLPGQAPPSEHVRELCRTADGACVGASSQWFAQTLSALAVPQVGASALQAKVEQLWGDLQNVREFAALEFAWTMRQFHAPHLWSKDEVFEAIAQHRKALESGPEGDTAYPDLRTPEWEVFSSPVPPEPTDDFTLRRDPQGVPTALAGYLTDVGQAERSSR